MQLKWLGHSCFELAHTKRVLIDPYLSQNPAAPKVEVNPEIIAVTHGHADHLGDTVDLAREYGCRVVSIHEVSKYLATMGIQCESMNKGGTITIEGVEFTMTEAVHSSSIDGRGAGCPAGFVIKDNISVYHAGDTALFGDMKLIGELYRPEVALLPIGDRYTMGIREAAIAASWIHPRVVIPMHYNTTPAIEQLPEKFSELVSSLCPSKVVILKPGESFEFR